jgi:hypothetical protein
MHLSRNKLFRSPRLLTSQRNGRGEYQGAGAEENTTAQSSKRKLIIKKKIQLPIRNLTFQSRPQHQIRRQLLKVKPRERLRSKMSFSWWV